MCLSTMREWKGLWTEPGRYYLVITEQAAVRLKNLVEPDMLTVVAKSGGKLLLTNHPVAQ